jgi:hypothetical protein
MLDVCGVPVRIRGMNLRRQNCSEKIIVGAGMMACSIVANELSESSGFGGTMWGGISSSADCDR